MLLHDPRCLQERAQVVQRQCVATMQAKAERLQAFQAGVRARVRAQRAASTKVTRCHSNTSDLPCHSFTSDL